ncbi:type I-E CRISPR-associated protein Cse2/CasB [Nocardia vaccinii]|uniref:type I-E CRISPR-associated protein Cse2/CasB n=1 Tax=Nocardia vaccinii TaxID=1822 RepID=UPI00082ABB74|nr:type I-E CRISPR-associated protein Cse2/CasB [Nocardia vaccinii]
MSTTTEQTSAAPARAYRLAVLGRALDGQLKRLQAEFRQGTPSARADLARLRRGLGRPPGEMPEIWGLTIAVVPEEVRWGPGERRLDEHGQELASRTEQAAHAALTLFALHQQSMTGPAHVPGVRFGTAVRNLAAHPERSTDAITRRFMAVSTAQSMDELLVHVRGLITQLRADQRGFDYARFADDLVDLLTPGREVGARLAWGRDFYRINRGTETPTGDTEKSSDTDTSATQE